MDYYDLGTYGRAVTTSSPQAQIWFDRGLNWLYGFNHAEAIKCFGKAAESDPNCAMAHWGIAYAAGPNYNLPWHRYDPAGKQAALAASYDAMKAAFAVIDKASPIEQALIRALPARYPQREAIDDQKHWDKAFTVEMRKLFKAHPDDLDLRSVFVEAIMNETPWLMWDLKTGKATPGAGTDEAVEVLEQAFRDIPASWDHPGLLHLYVHLMEMSPFPQRALRAGDRLRDLVPDSGHLIHMPTHIDVLCGNYRDVVVYNQKAVAVDRKFLAREGAMNVYALYRSHDHHFVVYGAMFLGQYTPAIKAAQELIDTTPEELLRIPSPPMADFIESYLSVKQHVLVRFGKWREIIAQELPKDQALYCGTTAMTLYAKGVAHSVLGEIEAAERMREAFRAAKARVPESRRLHNNTMVDMLAIAEEMLTGELEYRRGNFDLAFAHLRRAVELDDALPYDEPWGWMQPTRHALGALLLEQGHLEEAEAVYRADLGFDGKTNRACWHPENVWSLHGLHECLVRRGEKVEVPLIKARLDLALARAEVPIRSSCLCRRQAA
ncbi:tetratricopeptide repeat protein [Reyranella sp.]|uniref:tetratricopeptide repeat protein n=1 Tax=Reyranella sp. TaxID=1929291 RepID=UPI0027301D19|nr:tetratricopeptide repeat protein [Reyranella sp.]MDP2375974.1 tetratricopeptide repeat protein [Reyranella sp.]